MGHGIPTSSHLRMVFSFYKHYKNKNSQALGILPVQTDSGAAMEMN